MYHDNELVVRPIDEKDLPRIWELVFKEEKPEWKKWDAPYFPHFTKTYEEFLKEADHWAWTANRWAIEVDGEVVGMLSYYWEHEASKWLEVGIILYESGNWSKGIGTRALGIWIEHLFETLPLVRIGFSTWSGNKRMMRVGEKLGMKVEARIRKARYYQGMYFDSIKMGVLREEWEAYTQ